MCKIQPAHRTWSVVRGGVDSRRRLCVGNALKLPCPPNISVFWNGGSLLGITVGIQIATGLILSIRYNRDASIAFGVVLGISRESDFGWCFRYSHANGARLLFLLLFLHIGRGVYFGRYRYIAVWVIGLLMLFVYIGRAFLGYVLPWGQMRYWGATVITNLISALPYVGRTVVVWV